MNNYIVVIPENMVPVLLALLPGLQFMAIGAVTHAEDPDQKKYLVNIEPEKPSDESNSG